MSKTFNISFQDERLDFKPGALGNGRHLVTEDLDGAKVHVDIQHDHIAGVHGEKDGKPVDSFYLMRSDSSGEESLAKRMHCYLCACSGDSCTCREIPCW